MVAGKMRPPYTPLANEKILRRHLHSVVFAAFFLWAKERMGIDYRAVGPFFIPEEGVRDGRSLLKEYLAGCPEDLSTACFNIMPTAMQKVFGVEDWLWITELTNEQETGVLDLAFAEVQDDFKYLNDMIVKALADFQKNMENTKLLDRIKVQQEIITDIRERELLGFLGSRNVLPKYGFPTDVVELRTNHLGLHQKPPKLSLIAIFVWQSRNLLRQRSDCSEESLDELWFTNPSAACLAHL